MISVISAIDLHNIISVQPSPSDKIPPLLLIDLRPRSQFNKGRIQGAISIQLPNEVYIKTNLSNSQLISEVEKHIDKQYLGFFKWRTISQVVIYGDDSEKVNWLAKVIQQENRSRGVYTLNDSFEQFVRKFPYLNTTSLVKMHTYPSILFDYLYLGSFQSAKDKHVLKSLKISMIVNCAKECECCFETIEYLTLNLDDSLDENLSKERLALAVEFIEKAKSMNKKVLVHCLEGRSRSATVCCAYLMMAKKWSFEKSLEYIKKCRPSASPNEVCCLRF